MREPEEYLGKLDAGDPQEEGLRVRWGGGSRLGVNHSPGVNLKRVCPACWLCKQIDPLRLDPPGRGHLLVALLRRLPAPLVKPTY